MVICIWKKACAARENPSRNGCDWWEQKDWSFASEIPKMRKMSQTMTTETISTQKQPEVAKIAKSSQRLPKMTNNDQKPQPELEAASSWWNARVPPAQWRLLSHWRHFEGFTAKPIRAASWVRKVRAWGNWATSAPLTSGAFASLILVGGQRMATNGKDDQKNGEMCH